MRKCHFMVQPSAILWFKAHFCDLKHNFAVWQRYASNDPDFPIECMFEGLPSAPAKPCGLLKQPENGKSLGLGRFCVGSHSRQRYAFSRPLYVGVPVRRISKFGPRSRQGYAFKAAKLCFKAQFS